MTNEKKFTLEGIEFTFNEYVMKPIVETGNWSDYWEKSLMESIC